MATRKVSRAGDWELGLSEGYALLLPTPASQVQFSLAVAGLLGGRLVRGGGGA